MRHHRRLSHGRGIESLRLVVAGAAAVLLATQGCASTPEDAVAPNFGKSSTAVDTKPAAPGTTYPEGGCISRMPGQVLTAEEAVVRFSTSLVCPGYVTIVPGTPVTFKNQDSVAHTITITEGTMPGGRTIDTGVAPAGQTWVRSFDSPATYTYLVDAIPTFRGAVEVVQPGSAQH